MVTPNRPTGKTTAPSPAAMKAAKIEKQKEREAAERNAEEKKSYGTEEKPPEEKPTAAGTGSIVVNGVTYYAQKPTAAALDTTGADVFGRAEMVTEVLALATAYVNREAEDAKTALTNVLCGLGIVLTEEQTYAVAELVAASVDQEEAAPVSGETEEEAGRV